SRDPYWSTLGYETWQGITDVTELPESLMLNMLDLNRQKWESANWLPLLQVIIAKYSLDLGNLTAENLNSAGYDLYEKKDYAAAMQLFIEAMKIDPTYVFAHYNFACAGSLYLQYWSNKDKGIYAQQEGQYNQEIIDTVTDEVFQNLSISFFLASRYLEKSKTDPDLEYIRQLKRYSNMRQNISEPNFWTIYGYFKSTVSNIEEYPESGQLSITLDGGFYSSFTIFDLISNHKGGINQWEFDYHNYINKQNVSLNEVDYGSLMQWGYRINYEYININNDESRQPYIIAYKNKLKIEGLIHNDKHWNISSTHTVYSYEVGYPQKNQTHVLDFEFNNKWEISSQQLFFNSIREYYQQNVYIRKKSIEKSLKKMRY
uniref:tetratricopeptide repeat protein n=1 Tax=Spirochaeta cellobiosiphila TaxID=504483 RepID=UPI00055D1716